MIKFLDSTVAVFILVVIATVNVTALALFIGLTGPREGEKRSPSWLLYHISWIMAVIAAAMAHCCPSVTRFLTYLVS